MTDLVGRYRAILEDPGITSRLFLPRKSEVDRPFNIDCNGATLVCRYNVLDSARFTVLYFHGNGEVVSDYEYSLPPIFEAFDCSCLLAEYRGYGMSSGEPSLVNLIEDVPHIVRAVNVPPDRLIFYGRSFGSLPAIHAASLFPEARGLVLESGIADLGMKVRGHWITDEPEATDELLADAIDHYFDHRNKLRAFRGFTAVTACTFDNLVRPSNAYGLHRFANDPKCLKIFLRGHHNTLFRDNINDYASIFAHLVHGIPIT